MSDRHQPPDTITSMMLNSITDICEYIGGYFPETEASFKPRLRNNTLLAASRMLIRRW